MMKMRCKIPAVCLSALLLTACGSVKHTELPSLTPISTGYVRVPAGAYEVPLYAQPSTDSREIAALGMNDPLVIYSLKDGWFSVESGSLTGFLYGDYVAFSEVQAADAAAVPASTAAPADTAPPASETEPDAAGSAPVQTAVTAVDAQQPAKPGELFISEEEVLKAANVTYSGHTFFSAFPNGVDANTYYADQFVPGAKAEVVTETVEDSTKKYEAQKGIRITYDPKAATWIQVSGTLYLYSWDWEKETGGNIVISEAGQAYFSFNQIFDQ